MSRFCLSCSSNSIHTCYPTDSLSHIRIRIRIQAPVHIQAPSIASNHVPHVMSCRVVSIMSSLQPKVLIFATIVHFPPFRACPVLLPFPPISVNLIMFVEGECPYMAWQCPLSYHMSYHTISYHIISYHIISYHILYYTIH
jgi:hypothetical protein